MPKSVKGGHWEFLNINCLQNRGKMKGGHSGDIKKFAKKSLTKPKKPAQKIFGHGRDSNLRPFAWQTSKTIRINLYGKRQ